jgi:hypothetical protein
MPCKARITAWCREISFKLAEAEKAGDIKRFQKLRAKWLDLQRMALGQTG